MKKITKIFVLAIASMVALASCQKVNDVEATFQPKVLKAVFEDELSKTVLSENFQIQWSDSDKITGFDLDCKNYTSTETSVSEDKLEATFTFGSVSLEDDIVYAMYPADAAATMTSGGVITTTLPLVQNAVAGSFDPKANLALANGGEENVKFFNAGGLLAFDIKNDNITKIEIEAGSYENFAGPANLNFAEGEPLLQSTCGSDLHKVTLQGEFINGKTYYAVVFPAEYSSLKMVFTRNDGKTATFTNSKTLTVLRNGVVTVWKNAIDDSKWKGSDPSKNCFKKVTETPDSWEGDYLIVYDNTYAMDTHSGNQNANTFATYQDISEYYDSENNSFAVNSTTEALVYTAEATDNGYSLYCVSDQSYLGITAGTTGTGSKLRWNTQYSESACDWILGVGSVKNVGSSTLYIRWNNNSGSERFAAYGETGQKAITLFKRSSAGPVVTKYDVTCATVANGTISASPVKAAEGVIVTLTATPNTGYEFESWNVTNASTSAAITVNDNKFTMPAANVNVSATFKEKESEALTTMDEIFAKATEVGSTKTDVKVGFTNCVVTGVAGSNVYVVDANGTKGLIIYQANHGFEVGDKLNGEVNCQVYLYNGSSDLVGVTSTSSGLTVTKDGVVAPQTISIADLSGVNTGAVLSFAELTYNGTVFSDGTNTITPYKTFITLPTLISGKKYSVTGVYIQYRDTKEIAPRKAEDIVEKAATKYAVSVATVANGTLSVDYTQATEGQTVTITATPASGYKLKAGSVKVTKASSGTVTVTNDKTFTMPAEAVTVSAEFEENGGTHGWVRCTSVVDITSGGTFIIGYEATANSGKLIPMKNTGGTATTSAVGYMANGSEIDMATVTTTSDYEFTIVASTSVTGAVCIKCGDNFIGNTNTKNNLKLFTEESATTSFGVTVGTNDVFTFKIAANTSYHTLQYNASSPRFAVYGGAQKNLVVYKYK